jgi:hypothetical protein
LEQLIKREIERQEAADKGRQSIIIRLGMGTDAESRAGKLPPELPPDASESTEIAPYKAASR